MMQTAGRPVDTRNLNDQTRRPLISIVAPVYACDSCLWQLYARLRTTLEQISPAFEIILVNDGSPDNAWDVIGRICEQDRRVKGINFSRNFGQHYAITAGLDRVSGQWIVVMDCDLQDQPEEIPKLYNKAVEGYDVVFGRRICRKDRLFKRLTSRLFNRVMSALLDQKLDPTTANFGIFHRTVIDSFRQLRELNRSFPMFVRWLGFRRTAVDIEHAKRLDGKSSYTFLKLFRFAISNVAAYSNKPLTLSVYFGLTVSTLSFLFAIYFVVRYLYRGVAVEGWTSLMVSLYFVAGLLFANLGILGLYIGKTFDEIKARPLYVVKDLLNLEELPGDAFPIADAGTMISTVNETSSA